MPDDASLEDALKRWLETVSPQESRAAVRRLAAYVTNLGREVDSATGGDFPIGQALRLLRIRAGLTQTAASKREGAPDHRTLSHWETRRKLPSLKLLHEYLGSLGLDFCDLQVALDLISGHPAGERLGNLTLRLEQIEERVGELESR